MIRNQLQLLLLFFFLQSISVLAQADSTFHIKGRNTIANSSKTLSAVNVFNIKSQHGVISNVEGIFEIAVTQWPVHLQFSYIGFESQAVWIENPGDKWLDIQLHPAISTLPGVVVSAQPIIETITKATYTVRDYVFVGKQLLLVTYPGLQQGNALLLIDEDGTLLDSFSLKGIRRFDFLHKSCTGRIHLVTDTEDYEIAIENSYIDLVGLNSRREFSRVVEPCVGSTDSLLIYRHRFCIGQLLRFRAFDKFSDHHFLITEVSNDKNLERRYEEELASSVGYIDYLNISWEEKQLELRRILERNMELASLVHLFYKPIDVPLLLIGQQLCLFNHLTGYLQFYDLAGTSTQSIPVHYQNTKKWDGEIFFDAIDEKVYTLFEHPNGKVLRQINLKDGTLGNPLLINCAIVEQIKVNDGNLYYLESGVSLSYYNRVLRKVKL